MPEVDGKITLRLEKVQALDLQWAIFSRIRELTHQRQVAKTENIKTQAENEIIRLGTVLEKLPTTYPTREELGEDG